MGSAGHVCTYPYLQLQKHPTLRVLNHKFEFHQLQIVKRNMNALSNLARGVCKQLVVDYACLECNARRDGHPYCLVATPPHSSCVIVDKTCSKQGCKC